MPAVKKQRIGRPRSKSAPAVLRSPKSPIKRKQWSYETMVAALEAVKGGETILGAARTYGVPRSTLQDRGGARASSECVSLLKEREEKKRIEGEVKEKRKIERERKKKEREEMAKCKAEERARKAAERSARLVKKSAPKARAPV